MEKLEPKRPVANGNESLRKPEIEAAYNQNATTMTTDIAESLVALTPQDREKIMSLVARQLALDALKRRSSDGTTHNRIDNQMLSK